MVDILQKVENEIDDIINDIIESLRFPELKQNLYHNIINNLTKLKHVGRISNERGIDTSKQILVNILAALDKNNCINSNMKIYQVIKESKNANIIDNRIGYHASRISEIRNCAQHYQKKIKSDLFEITKSEYIETKIHLIEVLRFFMEKIFGYIYVFGSEVTEKMIDEAIEIDRECYTGDQDIFQGTREVCFKWNTKNPEIYTMILHPITRQVIGYINMMPVSEMIFNEIENGSIIDMNIPAEEIISYENGNKPPYYLYLCSTAIRPSHQVSIENRTFSNPIFPLKLAFIRRILQLAEEKNIFFSKMVADAINDSGSRLCRLMNMKMVKVSNHDSVIFRADMLPPSIKVGGPEGKKLIELYKEKSFHANF
jgi:hypothetical protein